MNAIFSWYRNALRHPRYRWWIILGTFAYLISPIDISPDLVPLVGQIDDVALITLLFAELSQMLIANFTNRRDVPGSTDTAADSGTTVDVEAVSMED